MKLELEINGELEHVLTRLAENGEGGDGEDVTPEQVAEQLLRESAADVYQQVVVRGG